MSVRIAYINAAVDLRSHWKVRELAAMLNCSYTEAVGYLVLLWMFTATASEESQLTGAIGRFKPKVLEAELNWIGAETSLWQALIDTGWLDHKGAEEVTVHDWSEHSGRGVSALVAKRNRMRVSRADRADGGVSTRGDTVLTRGDTATRTGDISRVSTGVLTRGDTVLTRGDTHRPTVTDTDTVTSTPYGSTAKPLGEPLREEIVVAPKRQRITSRMTAEVSAIETADMAGLDSIVVGTPLRQIDAGSTAGIRSLWAVFDQNLGAARTRSEKGRRAAAIRDLLEAGIDSVTLEVALLNWPKVMKSATCTETGIASHIGRLTEGFQVRTETDRTGRKSIPDLLDGWADAQEEVTDGTKGSRLLGRSPRPMGSLPDQTHD